MWGFQKLKVLHCVSVTTKGALPILEKHLNGQQYEELNLAIYKKKKASVEVADLSHILQPEHLQTLQG